VTRPDNSQRFFSDKQTEIDMDNNQKDNFQYMSPHEGNSQIDKTYKSIVICTDISNNCSYYSDKKFYPYMISIKI